MIARLAGKDLHAAERRTFSRAHVRATRVLSRRVQRETTGRADRVLADSWDASWLDPTRTARSKTFVRAVKRVRSISERCSSLELELSLEPERYPRVGITSLRRTDLGRPARRLKPTFATGQLVVNYRCRLGLIRVGCSRLCDQKLCRKTLVV